MITDPPAHQSIVKPAATDDTTQDAETIEISAGTAKKPGKRHTVTATKHSSRSNGAIVSSLSRKQPCSTTDPLAEPAVTEERQDCSGPRDTLDSVATVSFTTTADSVLKDDVTLEDWSPLSLGEADSASFFAQKLESAQLTAFQNSQSTPAGDELPFLHPGTSLVVSTRNEVHGRSRVPPESQLAGGRHALLAQPIIETPAPTYHVVPQGPNGSTVHPPLTDATPLYSGSVHPSLFATVDSRICDQTPVNAIEVQSVNTNCGIIHPALTAAAELVNAATNNIYAGSMTAPTFAAVKVASSNTSTKIKKKNPLRVTLRVSKQNTTATDEPHGKSIAAKATARTHNSYKKDVWTFDEDLQDDDKDLHCTCPNTRCLKLYCVCFQRGVFCNNRKCKCKHCKNTKRESGPNGIRTMAVDAITLRRPDAFGKRPKQTGLGCACKRNRCLKKYCACFAEESFCDDEKCYCTNCDNHSRRHANVAERAPTGPVEVAASTTMTPTETAKV